MHGFALNVNTNLEYFNKIIPCGIIGKEVTNLTEELESAIELDVVKTKILNQFKEYFGYDNILFKGGNKDILLS